MSIVFHLVVLVLTCARCYMTWSFVLSLLGPGCWGVLVTMLLIPISGLIIASLFYVTYYDIVIYAGCILLFVSGIYKILIGLRPGQASTFRTCFDIYIVCMAAFCLWFHEAYQYHVPIIIHLATFNWVMSSIYSVYLGVWEPSRRVMAAVILLIGWIYCTTFSHGPHLSTSISWHMAGDMMTIFAVFGTCLLRWFFG